MYRSKMSQVMMYKAKGHNSQHWILKIMLDVLIIPLSVYLLFCVFRGDFFDYTSITLWFGNIVNVVLMISFLLVAGMSVYYSMLDVVKDYVHHTFYRFILMFLIKIGCIFLVILGLVAIFHLIIT